MCSPDEVSQVCYLRRFQFGQFSRVLHIQPCARAFIFNDCFFSWRGRCCHSDQRFLSVIYKHNPRCVVLVSVSVDSIIGFSPRLTVATKSEFVVSDHFDQIGTGTSLNERTGVAGGFWLGNLLRTPRKGFLLTKTRGQQNFFWKKNRSFFFVLTGGTLWKSKKNRNFFRKTFHLCPAFSSIKSLFEESWASFRVKNHPQPMSVH